MVDAGWNANTPCGATRRRGKRRRHGVASLLQTFALTATVCGATAVLSTTSRLATAEEAAQATALGRVVAHGCGMECRVKKLQQLSLRELIAIDGLLRGESLVGSDAHFHKSSDVEQRFKVRRRKLLQAQKGNTFGAVSAEYAPTVVGGGPPLRFAPLYQPSLEGYYPVMGYEEASPMCKSLLNEYYGACMFKTKPSSFRESHAHLRYSPSKSSRERLKTAGPFSSLQDTLKLADQIADGT